MDVLRSVSCAAQLEGAGIFIGLIKESLLSVHEFLLVSVCVEVVALRVEHLEVVEVDLFASCQLNGFKQLEVNQLELFITH